MDAGLLTPTSQLVVSYQFILSLRELRSVPRLDRHPEAALNAVNQVIRSLPPSRSRKGKGINWSRSVLDPQVLVAMSKSQQLYKELAGKNTIDNTDLPDDLHREILPLKVRPINLETSLFLF